LYDALVYRMTVISSYIDKTVDWWKHGVTIKCSDRSYNRMDSFHEPC